jgi:hypothetical protein
VQRSSIQSQVMRLTLLLGALAFALDLPLYLVLTHVPWSVFPIWLMPVVMVSCTASGLLAVWARDRVARIRQLRALGEASAVLVLVGAVPILLGFGAGYASAALGNGPNQVATDWLPVQVLLLFTAILCALQPFLLFHGTRVAAVMLLVQGAIACVLLSIPGTPLHPWSLLPALTGASARLIFVVQGTLIMAAMAVCWLRGLLVSWQQRHVKVMEDAPSIATASAMVLITPVVLAMILAAVLPSVPLPAFSSLTAFWQQHDPVSSRLPFSSVSSTGGTPLLLPNATVRLGTPDVTSDAVVLTWRAYELSGGGSQDPLSSLASPPPFVFATYDRFSSDGVWSMSSTTLGAVNATLRTAPDAASLVASVTPMQAVSNTLVTFDASTHVGGAQPRLLSSQTTTLQLASWQSATPWQSGTAYQDTASVLSQTDMQAGVATSTNLPATELTRLLYVPAALQHGMRALVTRWTTPGETPIQTAQMLAKGMRSSFTLVAQPESSDAGGLTFLENMLTTHRGNALTWATLHVLLCRMAGIPARLASGFTPGISNVRTGVTTVLDRDATWMTQIATRVGWLHVGALDQVQPAQVVEKSKGATGSTVPQSPTPTPQVLGAQEKQPVLHHHRSEAHGREVWPARMLALVLVGAFLVGSAAWMARRRGLRYRREHGPLASEIRWLLLRVLRTASWLTPGVETRVLTPRQVGRFLARVLPSPVAERIYALADLYSQLAYAPELPHPPQGRRSTYRDTAHRAEQILRRQIRTVLDSRKGEKHT